MKCMKRGTALLLGLALLSGPLLSPGSGSLRAQTLTPSPGAVEVYQTVKGGAMDERLPDMYFSGADQGRPEHARISALPGQLRQELLGLGGAMTEASAYNLERLSPEQKEEVYAAYYGEEGAHYSLVRSTVGSADFSVKSYSYADEPSDDPSIPNFDLGHDWDYVIPALQKLYSYRPDVLHYAAPWAPPAWMKTRGVRRGETGTAGLSLKDNSLNPAYYPHYANYLVKYLQAYAELGMPIYSLSLQNESQNNPKWEACTWSIPATITFIGQHLGPALDRAGLDPKLLIWDWDKGNDPMHADGFIAYNEGVLADETAARYIDGIAFHWYAGDLWHEIAGKPMWSRDFYSLDQLQRSHPEVELHATEACQEKGPWLGSFDPADRYIYDILNDFEHGTKSWIDWNLLLDSEGGPTQGVVNQCHAPIMISESGSLLYNPAYYILKRLSREIQPGARSVATISSTESVERTLVRRTDGRYAAFLGNVQDYAQTVDYVHDQQLLTLTLPPHSMTTLVYEAPGSLQELPVQAAEASSAEWHPWRNYGAAKAIDGDPNTRWASDWKDQQHLTLDLGETRVLSAVALDFECGADAAFAIQVSDDGLDFRNVSVVEARTYASAAKAQVNFDPVAARYVRFLGIQRSNRYGFSLREMQVFGY